jgi:hypothetical protein
MQHPSPDVGGCVLAPQVADYNIVDATTECPNQSARFNFLIKRIIYSKSVDIFIPV